MVFSPLQQQPDTIRAKNFSPLQSDTTAWQTVDIPHNWDKYEGARGLKHGNRHGTALYQKTFCIEKQGDRKRYFLFFEGVGSYATVYVNGSLAGKHAGGRTAFTLDITDFIDFTHENKLFVIAEHPPMITDLPWVCGGCSSEWGFSEGSQPMGIFRPVTLIVTGEVRIEPFGVHAWNHAPAISENDTLFILNVNTEIKNYGDRDREFEIIQKLTDKDGRQIERITGKINLKACEVSTIHQESQAITNPHLWSTENPYLYKLHTIIKENGKVIDEEITPYGFRWISFPLSREDGDKRFYLNGKPLFINGVCEYEHLLGQSHAFSEEQIISRVNQIKAAGFNAFRDAHQPHNLLYQKQWEKMGTLLWTQFSAHIWYDTPEFRKNFKNNLREWVKERRSSPAVILWGLQNESVLPEDFARECTEIIREMDPTSPAQRLVTTCNGGAGTDWNVIQNWSGTYGGNLENYAQELSREEQLLNGEYGAWRSIGLHSEDVTAKNSEEAMCRILETKIRLAEQAKDSVCGQFQWIYNSHDNPGRIQNDEGAREIDKTGPFNYKGLITPWEEPTDAYYLYRANYADKHKSPMVYIVSHTWTDRWKTTGIKNGISVYSNCDEVELFNEGNSLGIRNNQGKGTHFQWDGVNIQSNLLFAVGLVGGKIVAYDCLVLQDLPESKELQNTDNILNKDFYNNLAPKKNLNYLYRINCGGQDYTDTNGNLWQADVPKQNGTYWGSLSWADEWDDLPAFLVSQGETNDPIEEAKDGRLFQTFRYGRDKLKYIFPLPDGEYHVELYFVEPWWGRDKSMDCEGFRIFDVAVSGETVIKNLDIWKEAGANKALKKTLKAHAANGFLEIAFPRVLAGQAIISAIAIAAQNDSVKAAPASPKKIDDGTKKRRIDEPETSPAVSYKQDTVDVSENTVSWTITTGIANVYALRFKYKNTSQEMIKAKIQILSSDGRTMRDDTMQFPVTPDKWRIINTTTVVPINAGKYKVVISGENISNLKFESLDVQ
ncbi:MAG: DUF4982 domain-containing protein [Dysgonamonadaceae bacterium]|jgi:hypothetical protein|nr:DUF4982 domain-containing protein [Dysgonamonadaceae bacterium]